MARTRIPKLDGINFDGIKSKLRFDAPSSEPAGDGYADEYGNDSYADEYGADGYADEFGDDGYAENYDSYNEYDEYGAGEGTGFGAYAPKSGRHAASRPVSAGRRSAAFGEASSPNLVSVDDVRRSAPSSYGYDAAPEPAGQNFAPIQQPAPFQSFDPYEAYSGAGAVAHAPSRSVVVLEPVQYAEVERVAKSLRAGDVVVLVLRNTQDQLAKRILDFSFGAASMVDARVDCIADKVFAISCGAALSDAERFELRSKGVM